MLKMHHGFLIDVFPYESGETAIVLKGEIQRIAIDQLKDHKYL